VHRLRLSLPLSLRLRLSLPLRLPLSLRYPAQVRNRLPKTAAQSTWAALLCPRRATNSAI